MSPTGKGGNYIYIYNLVSILLLLGARAGIVKKQFAF